MINYDPHRIKKPLRLDTLPEVIDALEELLVLKEERNDPAILAGNGS